MWEAKVWEEEENVTFENVGDVWKWKWEGGHQQFLGYALNDDDPLGALPNHFSVSLIFYINICEKFYINV